jgi:hypothetical protein
VTLHAPACANCPHRAVHAHSRWRISLSHPAGILSDVESPSLRFAEAVRALGLEARRSGLRMPAFRSPPRLAGVARSVRRRADGDATIAVVVRGRPWPAVLADMVEGIVVANHLHGAGADRVRALLWSRVGSGETVAA